MDSKIANQILLGICIASFIMGLIVTIRGMPWGGIQMVGSAIIGFLAYRGIKKAEQREAMGDKRSWWQRTGDEYEEEVINRTIQKWIKEGKIPKDASEEVIEDCKAQLKQALHEKERPVQIDVKPITGTKDLCGEVVLSRAEASNGIEKTIQFVRDNQKTNIMVKISHGVRDGMKIKYKGCGLAGNPPGNLFLIIRVA